MRPKTCAAGSERCSRAGAAGFTLIELLAVLMLAGLLLAVVPPMISNAVPGAQLKGVARSLAGALRQTRNQAISEARPRQLMIDLEAREIRPPGGSRPIGIPPQVDVELTVAASQRRSADVAGVGFFPDGSSTGGRIRLLRAGIHYQVDIDWLTGRISLGE